MLFVHNAAKDRAYDAGRRTPIGGPAGEPEIEAPLEADVDTFEEGMPPPYHWGHMKTVAALIVGEPILVSTDGLRDCRCDVSGDRQEPPSPLPAAL